MHPWKRALISILRPIDQFYDYLKYVLRKYLRLGRKAPIDILSYRGYGNGRKVFLKGRVVKEKLIQTTEWDSDWKNFRNNLRRFLSSEIQGARVEAKVNGHSYELVTDKEGYFDLNIEMPDPLPSLSNPWLPVELVVTATPFRQTRVESSAQILVPQNCKYGIISDIDDTILQTDVTSTLKIRMLYLTFLKNAFKRNAFKEVGAFYNALRQGKEANAQNPIFYVSNGPWNLYDFLTDFLDLNNLPKGPVLLRDFGIPNKRFPKGYQGHKKESIKKIMNTFPDLPFILIGDSGEKDTDIYLSLAEEFPGRVKSIYIRDVESPRRAKRIAQLIKNASGIDAYFVKDYYQAAEYASKKGYLNFDLFQSIRKRKVPKPTQDA
ncbi:MAG: DUF2183 domain-containing protein [Saprospiraceae bacterium]|nr:DUF2183 domain-containing protein [Saprospiraceae bacterium]